jgi:hypothetical protein
MEAFLPITHRDRRVVRKSTRLNGLAHEGLNDVNITTSGLLEYQQIRHTDLNEPKVRLFKSDRPSGPYHRVKFLDRFRGDWTEKRPALGASSWDSSAIDLFEPAPGYLTAITTDEEHWYQEYR